MHSFGDRTWHPSGARPHILIPASPAAAYAAAVNARSARWWTTQPGGAVHGWDEVVQELPAHYLHVTLAWLDRLTSELDPADLVRLHDNLADRFSGLVPFEITIGPALVKSHAVEVYVDPVPELAALAAGARAALRTVFGDTAAPEPTSKPYRPHLSTLYGRRWYDSEGLIDTLAYTVDDHGDLLRTVTMPVTEVILVEHQDTFADSGFRWDDTTVRVIPLGTG